jgi:simple sugar transport system permease protein
MEMIATFIHRAVMQGIPLLYGSTGEIITEKSGNLNLGIPGIMYVGGVCGIIGAFFYQNSVAAITPFWSILIPLLCALLGSAFMSLIYAFLTITLRANQNVTGLALTTMGVGIGNFFGGSLATLYGEGGSLAMTDISKIFRATIPLPEGKFWEIFGNIFLTYGFLAYLAIVIAVIAGIVLNKTRVGLNLRAVGENPATADAAGINVIRYKYVATILGGTIAGLAKATAVYGYHAKQYFG